VELDTDGCVTYTHNVKNVVWRKIIETGNELLIFK
jgi:hypothetical protein